MLSKIKIKHKILAFVGLLLILFISERIIRNHYLNNIEEINNRISELRIPTSQNSTLLFLRLCETTQALQSYALIREDRFIKELTEAWEHANGNLTNLDLLSKQWTNPENVKKLNVIKPQLIAFKNLQENVARLIASGESSESIDKLVKQILDQYDIIGEILISVVDNQKLLLKNDEILLWKKIKRYNTIEKIILFSIVLFILISAVKFTDLLMDPISKLQRRVKEISEGNYDLENIVSTSDDEIGHLISHVNDMYETLRDTTDESRNLKTGVDKCALVSITNLKGEITYVNKIFIEASQYSEAELLGTNIRIVNSQFHPKEFFEDMWETVLNGKIWKDEIRNKAKDGTFFWADTTLIPIVKDNELQKIMSFQFLITKMKTQALKIKEQQAQLQKENALKNNLSIITNLSYERKNIFTVTSSILSKICDITDCVMGAIYTKPLTDKTNIFTLNGVHAHTHRKDIAKSFHLGEGIVGQCALEKSPIVISNIPDNYIEVSSGLGTAKPSFLYVVPILSSQEVIAVMEMATFKNLDPENFDLLINISESLGIILSNLLEKGLTEKHLKESHELTQKLQQSYAELEKKSKEVNSQAEELQSTNEELRQKSEELNAQAEELRASNEELERATAELNLQTEELRATNEELEETSRLREKQRADIEHKNKEMEKTQKELQIQTANLKKSSQYKSEFLANMSHELRNPLNSLLILSEVLLENSEENLNSEQIESLNIIHQGGEDLLALINDILDLSKVEAGQLDIIIEDVELHGLITNLDVQFRPTAKNKGIIFKAKLDKRIPEFIQTDRMRLKQILKNLLSNAFKFTNKGLVTLDVTQENNPTYLRSDDLRDRDLVVFSVTDTGIGILEHEQELIFNVFQQADGTTTREHGGTGLGLSISKQLAHLLKGEISVESEYGKGSTFRLLLPLNDPTEAIDLNKNIDQNISLSTIKQTAEHNTGLQEKTKTTLESKKIDFLLSGKNILIVDDDLRNSFALSAAFRNRNLNVHMTINGDEALTFLKETHEKIDFILMDIMMPILDGFSTMKRIRELHNHQHTPIIAITAKAMEKDKEKCLASGANAYISKPLKLDVLYDMMRNMLEGDFRRH